jgi:hypothetical protein
MRKRSLMLGATALAVLAFAACGDDGNSEDEDQITEAFEAVAVSGEPSACTEFQTQAFAEQTTDETGEAAIKQCEREAEDTVGEEIDVSNIEVDGDSATAEGAITGSFFDGQTIEVALVKEDGQWKLDEFSGFTEFDRDALLATFEEDISNDENASPEAKECVTSQLEAQSDQQLEDFLVGTDPEGEQRIFGPCVRFFGE